MLMLLTSNNSYICLRSFKIRTGRTVVQIDFSCEIEMYRYLLILNRNLEREFVNILYSKSLCHSETHL